VKRALPLLAVLLLAACQAPPQQPAAAQRPRQTANGEVAEALAHFARLRRLPAAELQREQEAARRGLLKAQDDATRMRLALALALPGAGAADTVRAIDALDPLTRNPESPLHALALLLSVQLQEQRRSEAQAAALQHKLDALLAIERNLAGRDGGLQRKR
jgi:hypothetical protein